MSGTIAKSSSSPIAWAASWSSRCSCATPPKQRKVRFIVSYGTPHEGSSVARIASIYDRDPLLNDLSDAGDNTFLTHLESNWRGSNSVNGIHRFCAYEPEDTRPDNRVGRYLPIPASSATSAPPMDAT